MPAGQQDSATAICHHTGAYKTPLQIYFSCLYIFFLLPWIFFIFISILSTISLPNFQNNNKHAHNNLYTAKVAFKGCVTF